MHMQNPSSLPRQVVPAKLRGPLPRAIPKQPWATMPVQVFRDVAKDKVTKMPKYKGWRTSSSWYSLTTEVDSNPGAPYGVITGEASKLFVVDYDPYKNEEGKDPINVDYLKKIYGDDAFIVETLSGGYHVYCDYDDTIRNSLLATIQQGLDTKGEGCVDFRGEGGFVVGPGTKYQIQEYKIVNGQKSTARDTKIPVSVFNELIELVKKTKTKTTKVACKASSSKTCQDLVADPKLLEILEHAGFTNVQFKWPNCPYNFTCDQFGKQCPLCDNVHDSNYYYVKFGKCGEIFVKNHSPRCKCRTIDTFQSMKYVFERNGCRINEGPVYLWHDGHTLQFYGRDKFTERFANWYCDEDQGSFISKWRKSRDMREYRKIDFCPDDDETPDDVYNLWEGFYAEKLEPTDDKDILKFMELVNIVAGCNYNPVAPFSETREVKYLLDWMAQIFQKPGTKPTTALIFRGAPGTGKTSICTVLSFLMDGKVMDGKEVLYYETGNAAQDVFGAFSDAFERRKVVVINEASSEDSFKHFQRLLNMVSDERGISVNKKFIQAFRIKNIAGMIFVSNKKVVVPITDDDRRFIVYEASTARRNDEKWFGDFWEWLTDTKLRAIYQFLMKRDISKVKWVSERPLTEAYKQMKRSCLPPRLKWFEYFITEDFPRKSTIPAERLRAHYERWDAKPIKPSEFGYLMKEIVAKIDEHNKSNNERYKNIVKKSARGPYDWTFDRQACFEWLQENAFTAAEELQDANVSNMHPCNA